MVSVVESWYNVCVLRSETMKKIILVMLVMMIITGCSSNSDKLYFFQNADDSYDLYTYEGKAETTEKYDGFKKVKNAGYIVEKNKKYGYISTSGKELIKLGKYDSIKALGKILVAKDTEDKITLLDSKGKELYKESDSVQITISGLPIIKQNKEYIVLTLEGEEFLKTKKEVKNADCIDNQYILVNYDKKLTLTDIEAKEKTEWEIDVTSVYALFDHSTKGYLLYDKNNKKVLLVNNVGKVDFAIDIEVEKIYFDKKLNIIVENQEKIYVVSDDGQKITEMNSYFQDTKNYVTKNTSLIYGPHKFYKDGKEKEVEGIQLDPEAGYTDHDVFPVYLRSKGYVYYGFDGKQVFDDVYEEVTTFDEFNVAIVSKKEGKYFLIDKKGKKLSKEYVNIELINYGYYAGYTTDNKYEVIDLTGKKVIDMEFMGSKDVVKYDNKMYGVFNKSGKTYIYDMSEYLELFTLQGEVEFNKDGYFIVNNRAYYTMKGKEIYSR